MFAIDRPNWVAARFNERSNNLARTNERFLVCQCDGLAELESSYRRHDRRMARARHNDDVDGWVRRCRNQTVDSRGTRVAALSSSESKFKGRGNLGLIARDLFQKSF